MKFPYVMNGWVTVGSRYIKTRKWWLNWKWINHPHKPGVAYLYSFTIAGFTVFP